MNIFAIRGAVTVAGNERAEIEKKTRTLIQAMLEKNGVGPRCTPVSLIISTTSDITAFYPARAVRESALVDVPLFSTLEPSIEGALPLCIRMLLTVSSKNKKQKAVPVYLGGAAALRPDLCRMETQNTSAEESKE